MFPCRYTVEMMLDTHGPDADELKASLLEDSTAELASPGHAVTASQGLLDEEEVVFMFVSRR